MTARKYGPFTTPIGTLAQDSLIKRKNIRYWVKLRLSAQDAEPIIQFVEQAIEKELADIHAGVVKIDWNDTGISDLEFLELDIRNDELLDTKAGKRPYERRDDGTIIFTFESAPGGSGVSSWRGKDWPRFCTVDGKRNSRIRKPKSVTEGRRLAVVYRVVMSRSGGQVCALLVFRAAHVRRQWGKVKR